MGYFIYTNRNPKNWRIVEELHESGERQRKTIVKEAYKILGFRSDMTTEEARERAKQLNLQAHLDKRKQVKAAERVADIKLSNSAYLPKIWVSKFEEHLQEITYGTSDRILTVMHHWSTSKKLIVELQLDPKDFYANKHKIYNRFIKMQFSADYSGKILRVMNLWGHFFSRSTNSFFQPIPRPKAMEKQKLAEAREDKTGVRREADPLTVALLNKAKSTFENNGLTLHWNWLSIALWFGLRPSELDSLTNLKNWRIERDAIKKIDVLMVYQSKLSNIPKDKRWKPIPIIFDEQKALIKLIKNQSFKRPLVKTLKKYIGDGIDNYSPRKGFTDLMLTNGFSIEDVSIFLGHRNIETTWRHYKDKFTFQMPKAS